MSSDKNNRIKILDGKIGNDSYFIGILEKKLYLKMITTYEFHIQFARVMGK
jgi:hypothetical protein